MVAITTRRVPRYTRARTAARAPSKASMCTRYNYKRIFKSGLICPAGRQAVWTGPP